LIPASLRGLAADVVGVYDVRRELRELRAHVARVEQHLYESQEAAAERSKTRWRNTAPTLNLTWDVPLSGDAFVDKVASYRAFGPDKSILEIGPGYGRLPKAMLERGVPMKRYLGVDLSEQNVRMLRSTFTDPRMTFVQGDILAAPPPERGFDVVVSSLVFKHLFPSFEVPLTHVASSLNPGAMVFIDLIEGSTRYFEPDDVTYLRHYTREEVTEIVGRAGLTLVGFDEVLHDADHPRLLFVARK
jgi:2-polyprenyl-3-methyl-5-hydroxy-6-metoxy-1,4-benzoquinol methylase